MGRPVGGLWELIKKNLGEGLWEACRWTCAWAGKYGTGKYGADK